MSEVYRAEKIMSIVGKTFQDPIDQDPIDQELKICLDNNQSIAGSRNCLLEAYNQWDEELNRVYGELLQRLNSEDQEVLKTAQLKWIEYRDKEFELVDKIYSGDRGSLDIIFNAGRRVELVKARVLELRNYVESIDRGGSENILDQGAFEGISKKGDFQEALADAIQKAKQQLKTDCVKWKLNEVFGENGGFTGIDYLRVSIIGVKSDCSDITSSESAAS